MHANGGINLFMLFGNALDLGKIFQIHANAQRMSNIVVAHACQNLVEVFGEFGKIEVAVRVDKHGGYGSINVKLAERDPVSLSLGEITSDLAAVFWQTRRMASSSIRDGDRETVMANRCFIIWGGGSP